MAVVLLLSLCGCITSFRTGAPLGPEQARIVAGDLAVAGVRAQRDGATGTNLPDTAAKFAKLTGAPDRSSTLSPDEFETLLDSPSEIRSALPRLPVVYASNSDAPHATTSARIIDLRRGEVIAASFEVGSDLDPDESPEFANSAAGRAVARMALERP
jgi:hypothetical protein